jgi:hypothetical protein
MCSSSLPTSENSGAGARGGGLQKLYTGEGKTISAEAWLAKSRCFAALNKTLSATPGRRVPPFHGSGFMPLTPSRQNPRLVNIPRQSRGL